MKNNASKKILGINLLLFGLLFGLVSFNKEILRPLYGHMQFGGILTGCFTNFIAAYIISLLPVIAVLIRSLKHGRKIVYTCALLVFGILTIEELVPMWGASTHYDPFDIIASGLGSLLAILTFEIIVSRRKNKWNKNE